MPNLSSDQCVLINEASSTQTAFFSYNSRYEINKISGKDKLSLRNIKIDDHALSGNVTGYFSAIFNNVKIQEHILNSDCNIFYWSILSTGGMRDLQDKHGTELIDKFYADLKESFTNNRQICSNEICKDIVLVEAKTITGGDEAYHAWTALKSYEDMDCHAIFDIGGQTGQFSNSSLRYSNYLGKERAMDALEDGAIPCYSHENKYNGIDCRDNIQSYLESNFKNILAIEHSNHCRIFVVSNFFHYFNDVCNSYLPYITNNNLNIDQQILLQITGLCSEKDSIGSLSLLAEGYKHITDAVCMHWSDDWSGVQAEFANGACFSGNHNYQVLKLLGIEDGHEVHAHGADWAPGAAMNVSV
jgi:hypothetical protein